MSDQQAINLQFWWDHATHSGQAKYGSLENLMRVTGLNWGRLNPLLHQEVRTLGEWWNILGKYLYRAGHGKGTGIEAMAQDLTQLIDPAKPHFARTTLSSYIHGTTLPKFQDHYAALFAITALPCFQLAGVAAPSARSVRQPRPAATAEEVQKELRFAEALADALLQQLQRLAEYHPTAVQLEPTLHQLQEIVLVTTNLAEGEENQRLMHQLANALKDAGLGAKPKRSD